MGTVTDAARMSPADALTGAQVAQLQAATSGTTWANLLVTKPAASNPGAVALVVDPTYFLAPLRVRSDGVKWRLDGLQDLAFNIEPLTGAAGTVNTEQLMRQWTAPPGFLTSLRWLRIARVDYKTATSDIYNAKLRAGAGVTPLTDLQIGTTATLTSTSRSLNTAALLTFPSPDSIRILGRQSGLSEWSGGQESAIYPQNFTFPDSDAAPTVFSCTMQMNTGTDSSQSGQAHFVVTGG